MRLQKLINDLQVSNISGMPDIEISAITADSRLVEPGALFVAVKGRTTDGHAYAHEAALAGAAAIIGEVPDIAIEVPYIQVEDSRTSLAQLAAAWNDHPARDLIMIGVTGTDGKSTTCNILYEILRSAGYQVGLITTVNAIIGEDVLETGLHVTTPGALDVQAYLRKMVDEGMTHCILEATSHGLAQRRVAACDFDIAVVTNITHEHLDYHGSYESYRDAKGTLFTSLEGSRKRERNPLSTAILNLDDESHAYLAAITTAKQITYGEADGAQARAAEIVSNREGVSFRILGTGYDHPAHTPLIGKYNVSNCLAAFSAAVEGLEVSPEHGISGIEAMQGVPGRMERIDMGQRFIAIVDFAHTPNALRRALETARSLTESRVIAVFGSAGLRDREKRRLMAEVSAELADISILTAEDPRTESLDQILEEMAAGAKSKGGVEGKTYFRERDRGEALRLAVRKAQVGDLVIACGKGHEQSMCFGEVEHPWDDRVGLRAALAEHLEMPGPMMPKLPTSP